MEDAHVLEGIACAHGGAPQPCAVAVSGRIWKATAFLVSAVAVVGLLAYALLSRPSSQAHVEYYRRTRCLLPGTAPEFAHADKLSAEEARQAQESRSYYRIHTMQERPAKVELFVVRAGRDTALVASYDYSYDRKERITKVEETHHNLLRTDTSHGHTAFLRTVSVDQHDSAGRVAAVTLRDRIVEGTTAVESRVRYAVYERDHGGAVTLCRVFDSNKALLGTYKLSYDQGILRRIRLFGPRNELLVDDDRSRSGGDNAIAVGTTLREVMACEKLDEDLVAD